jgi:hypothetical protein
MGKAHREVPPREVARPTNSWRVIVRSATLAAALLSGTLFTACPLYGPVAMYGPPPVPHEPDVKITDFSYTPASPIRSGDTLTFRATLSRHTDAGWISVAVRKPELIRIGCNDAGFPPDETAGDGVYTGALLWDGALGTGEGLGVYAELRWNDGAPGQILGGPPLTILPEEGGQP